MPRKNATTTKRQTTKRTGHSSRARTPPYHSHPDWSTARFWGWVRAALRKAWLKWPPRYIKLASAKRHTEEGVKYECEVCKEMFKTSGVEVDHIIPVGTLRQAEDLPTFVTNLFSPIENLRIVCKGCHKKKTQEDKES